MLEQAPEPGKSVTSKSANRRRIARYLVIFCVAQGVSIKIRMEGWDVGMHFTTRSCVWFLSIFIVPAYVGALIIDYFRGNIWKN